MSANEEAIPKLTAEIFLHLMDGLRSAPWRRAAQSQAQAPLGNCRSKFDQPLVWGPKSPTCLPRTLPQPCRARGQPRRGTHGGGHLLGGPRQPPTRSIHPWAPLLQLPQERTTTPGMPDRSTACPDRFPYTSAPNGFTHEHPFCTCMSAHHAHA